MKIYIISAVILVSVLAFLGFQRVVINELKYKNENLEFRLNQNLKQIEILSQNANEKEVITKEIIKFKDKVIYESKSDFCVNSANFAIKRLREKERND